MVKLGIYNRGIEIRNIGGDADYAYADGSDGDYYAIIRNAKQENLVGLIVEHCFVSNYSDYQNYLITDEKLRQLGLADATGIINALGLTQINRQQVGALAQANANVLKDGIYEIQSGVDNNYVINVVDQSTVNSANVQVY